MSDYNLLAEKLLKNLSENSKLRYQQDVGDFYHGEMSILSYLCFKGDGVSPSFLCDTLKMTTPRISAALSTLEKKGFVSRVTDSSDRRRQHIFITDGGRALTQSRYDEMREHIISVLKSIGEDDAREYVRIIGRINENVPV